MGKMVYFISAVIFIDLLLLATGQICIDGTCGLSSIIFNAVTNLLDLQFATFFTELIGNVGSLFTSKTGVGSLIVTAGVTAGAILFTTSESRLFTVMALTLGLVSGDFIFLASNLGLNPLVAAFIVAPLAIIFLLTTVEWTRGRD